ncbi:hypothetical protein [Companilactobacillus mishanensis]|uniref:hypothetical protein n=1 Tax=Companilactobacillus mishanensis TaxID=2486008 RepID=UPI001295F4EE|nr:hypothetical protein [Companilactobacillus mishanensis]MQS89178.1 hypothetical protein [Companilactobacillus mishanensis]
MDSYYTVNDMQKSLAYNKAIFTPKTISNWVRDFNTEQNARTYGRPRKRIFGNQKRKPTEYPQKWFMAMFDEHIEEIQKKSFNYDELHDQINEFDESPHFQDLIAQFSLSSYKSGMDTFDYGESIAHQQKEIIWEIIIEKLGIDKDRIYDDLYFEDREVEKNLLNYIDHTKEEK